MNVGCFQVSVLGLALAIGAAFVWHGWWDRHTGADVIGVLMLI